MGARAAAIHPWAKPARSIPWGVGGATSAPKKQAALRQHIDGALPAREGQVGIAPPWSRAASASWRWKDVRTSSGLPSAAPEPATEATR